MIISRTPYRLSFFGGGTDYPAWYREEGGAVLSTTIDKYCYLSVRVLPPFFELKHRVVWSHIESVWSIAEILHPAVREGLRFMGFDDAEGLEIHHQGDLPARAGMGSSSAFAVGLIRALTGLRGETIDTHALALRAIALEQDVLREHDGSQDQVASAYGGLNRIEFRPDGGITVEPVRLAPARLAALQAHLLLFYTGSSRLGSDVAADVVANLPARRGPLRALRAMVDQALEILTGPGDLGAFGRLLHESWLLKRELSPLVTRPETDATYERALAAGALGGKLLGAGGTGFMAFFVPPPRQRDVIRALADCLHVPFAFEREGSTVIHDPRWDRVLPAGKRRASRPDERREIVLSPEHPA
jgi:D-glycero-alpha-D-manno-heptose-7-phosphate kinase